MKKTALFLWGIWDWLYYKCNRMQYVSKNGNVFRVVRKTYKGPPLLTNDGHCICPGDQIIKIHLYNYGLAKKMVQSPSEIHFVLELRQELMHSLEGLCTHIASLSNQEEIKAIIGTSMLNKGADRLGFSLHDPEPTLTNELRNTLFKIIYLLMHPQGVQFLKKNGHRLQSKHLVMSTEELFRAYAAKKQVK